jgi:hypothetical protein
MCECGGIVVNLGMFSNNISFLVQIFGEVVVIGQCKLKQKLTSAE